MIRMGRRAFVRGLLAATIWLGGWRAVGAQPKPRALIFRVTRPRK